MNKEREYQKRKGGKRQSVLKIENIPKQQVLGSKDLRFYVFRTLICIIGKP